MAVNLFSYQRGNSILHKCNALAKIFFLTAFCIFIFVGAKWMSPFFIARTATCVFVPLLLLFLSGLSLRIFFNLWPVILTGVFVTAFRSFDLLAAFMPLTFLWQPLLLALYLKQLLHYR